MCGIAGICSSGRPLEPRLIKAMADVLRHRGPDDEGYLAIGPSGEAIELTGPESTVNGERIEDYRGPAKALLGHRRLSIIDLSPKAHQPMGSADGSLWMTYNGEIYNYIELREELKSLGHVFTSGSDTEVLLAAYKEWGPRCLDRLNGMWAFAMLDLKKNLLFASRDRFGVKPLYYTHENDVFSFASEVKSLLTLPFVNRKINPRAAFDYLVTGLEETEEEGFFSAVHELPPSSALVLDLKDSKIKTWKYHSLEYNGAWERFDAKRSEAFASEISLHIHDSVKARLRSDVPVGTCLSGGLDSSTIVCVANQLLSCGGASGERQKVLTACYDSSSVDESRWAELVVKQTGADWLRTWPRPEELLNDIKDLVRAQDFPFGSTSIYAQYRVMRLASENGLKVLLDGQGGDELFSGYTSCYAPYFSELLARAPMTFIKEFFELGNSPMTKGGLIKSLAKYTAARLTPSGLAPLVYGMKPPLAYIEKDFLREHASRLKNLSERKMPSLNAFLLQSMTGPGLKALLRYEDRNSMRFSVEARTPFADDIGLIRTVFNIPSSYKIHHGWSKHVLRQAVRDIVPAGIIGRTDKVGFATPEREWLSASRDFIRAAFESAPDGFIDRKKILSGLGALLGPGAKTSSAEVWRLLNFALWRDVYKV